MRDHASGHSAQPPGCIVPLRIGLGRSPRAEVNAPIKRAPPRATQERPGRHTITRPIAPRIVRYAEEGAARAAQLPYAFATLEQNLAGY